MHIYLLLKSNDIIDTRKLYKAIKTPFGDVFGYNCLGEKITYKIGDIVKESDNFTELINIGDIIETKDGIGVQEVIDIDSEKDKFFGIITNVTSFMYDYDVDEDMFDNYCGKELEENVIRLWKKDSNGNYKLVYEKR